LQQVIVSTRRAHLPRFGLALVLFALAAWPSTSVAQRPAGANEFTVKARQAIIMDADTGAVLFQHNPDELAPPASMSKLMTLAMAFKAIKGGQLKLEDELLMSENAWRKGGAPSGTSAMFVPVNTRARLDELLRGVIIQSGNDAAIAIAEAIAGSEARFADAMTEEARRLGLKKSTFRNATGLYDAEHLMSARELAMLARHIIRDYPDYYATFAQREFLYKKHRFFNRNPLIGLVPGADGLKTGYIKEAGYGIVASAKQDNRRLIVVVNGLSSADERRDEARRMLEWGFRAIGDYKLFDANEVIGHAKVWGGERLSVPLVGQQDVSVVLPKASANQRLRAEIIYKGPLKAPVRKGDQVATLRVTSAADAVNEVPLYASEDIAPGTIWQRGVSTLFLMATQWLP
jgi:D-alanyl-D-alanine carboxypeptidase (penicillin-binding protein 5/6)